MESEKSVHICLLPGEVGCANDRDCDAPLICGEDNECRNACDQDDDCPRRQECSRLGVCLELESAGVAGATNSVGIQPGRAGVDYRVVSNAGAIGVDGQWFTVAESGRSKSGSTESPSNGVWGGVAGSAGSSALAGQGLGGGGAESEAGNGRADGAAGGGVSTPARCADSSCRNGGRCEEGASSSFCCCPPGYVGERCESEETWMPFALTETMWGENTVGLIVVDQRDSQRLYASDANGTTGDQVWQSLDGGVNWEAYCGEVWGAEAIALAPTDDQTVYLAAGAGYGIHKVPGAGAACREISLGGYGYYTSVAVDPSDVSRVYAGSSRLATNTPGIYRSADAGTTWTQIHSELCITALMIDPMHGAVYATGMPDWDVFGSPDTSQAGVWRSTDDGKTWTPVLSGHGTVIAFTLSWTNTSHLLASTELSGVILSADGGESWRPTEGAEGLRVGVIASDPSDANLVYAGTTDHGVLRSVDGGATWADFSDGLEYATVHALAVDPNDSNTIYAGLETLGMYRRRLPGAAGTCTLQVPAGSDPYCLDTCLFAGDGWCDDGGPFSDFDTCDLGTDCQDCGTRTP